jgi:hypothetical protein
LPKEVSELDPKIPAEAWPAELLFVGQALDLPGRDFGHVEGAVITRSTTAATL